MPTFATTDIDQALEYFDRTSIAIAEATLGLSPAQWQFKPAPDRWSQAEILEHLVIVHDRLMGPMRELLMQAPAPPADRDWRAVDAIILEKVPQRSPRANAPEFVHPTGTMTPAEALDRLDRSYARLREFVQTTPDLREHAIESPPLRFITNGEHTLMDGLQMALILAGHDLRHAAQMREVQADPSYPR
ncbi:MAG TPA: DinB family protein [Bryobacteraceae bacterium]|nr:DinB family protein [Bryobacteraceae bacterium]